MKSIALAFASILTACHSPQVEPGQVWRFTSPNLHDPLVITNTVLRVEGNRVYYRSQGRTNWLYWRDFTWHLERIGGWAAGTDTQWPVEYP